MLQHKWFFKLATSIALMALSLGLCFALPKLPYLRLQALYQNLDHMFYDLNWKVYFKITDHAITDTANRSIEFDEDRIFIIDIDDKALKEMGTYNSWTREPHATVVRKLSQAGTSAIVFDIMFKEANHGARATQRFLKALENQGTVSLDTAKLRQSLDDDQLFLQSVRQNPNVIINGTVGNPIKYAYAEDQKELSSVQRVQSLNANSFFYPDWLPSDTLRMQLLDDVFPELLQSSHRFGLTNVIADADGIHRKEPLLYSYPDPKFKFSQGQKAGLIPSLALQTCLHLLSLRPDQIQITPGQKINLGPGLRIYRNQAGELVTSYPYLSMSMIQKLQSHKDTLLKWIQTSDTNTLAKQLEISSVVALHKDSAGEFSADIQSGQLLPQGHLEAIFATQDWDTLQWSKKGKSLDINIGLGYRLKWDETENSPSLSSPDDDSYTLDFSTLEQIHNAKKQFLAMSKDSTLHLSGPLHVKLKPSTGTLSSEILVFTPQVIQSLLVTNPDKIRALKFGDTLKFGPDIEIPIDADGRMMIKYVGPYENSMSQRRSYPTVSYQQFISGDQDANLASYQGKVALLGSTIAAMFDRTNTPFSTDYPGPLIHANLIQNILSQNFIRPLSSQSFLLILGLIALICALAHAWLSPLWSISTSALSALGYFVLQYEFFRRGWALGMTEPMFLILSITLLGLLAKYFLEQRERRKTVSMFKQYISPELIDQMIEQENMPTLGGQKSFLTAFFTDIASFSTFSEKIGDPVRLVELLNEYLSAMTDILMAERGTLDKYEGDAIIAFFGAPVPIENNARSACLAALGMQNKLLELRKKWQSEQSDEHDKWPEIVHQMHMRIGLNSGMIVTGNMGSEMRKNYTMMGDAVNLAARLESGAKQYGVYTMISHSTKEAAGEEFLTRRIDKIRVIGKSEAVLVYELVNTHQSASPEEIELCRIFELALDAYFDQNWDLAIQLFEQSLSLEIHHPQRDPGSKTSPSEVMLQRCHEYKIKAPAPEGELWDGTFTATEK